MQRRKICTVRYSPSGYSNERRWLRRLPTTEQERQGRLRPAGRPGPGSSGLGAERRSNVKFIVRSEAQSSITVQV